MPPEFRNDIVKYYLYQELMDGIIQELNNLSIND
jgi:hypothetical protein